MKAEKMIIKDINDNFKEDIDKKRKIIIYVEHSKSGIKPYVFERYINKKFNNKVDKYIIALAKEEFIPVEKLNSQSVIEILKQDLNKNYNEFKTRYPNAMLEKAYSFNYALDYDKNSNNAEIMSIALMRVSNGYCRVQYSPIIPLDKMTYAKLINDKNKDKEGKLIHDILTEKLIGIEAYGLIGYLTDGKYKTGNIYMENLLDIIPDYKDEQTKRSKLLKYKKFRAKKEAYIKSLKTEEERLMKATEE